VTVPSHAKLIWNCRRGMLELDLVLAQFIEQHMKHLNDQQLCVFERLLNYPDPDLYAYLMGQSLPDDEEIKQFVAYIRTDHSV